MSLLPHPPDGGLDEIAALVGDAARTFAADVEQFEAAADVDERVPTLAERVAPDPALAELAEGEFQASWWSARLAHDRDCAAWSEFPEYTPTYDRAAFAARLAAAHGRDGRAAVLRDAQRESGLELATWQAQYDEMCAREKASQYRLDQYELEHRRRREARRVAFDRESAVLRAQALRLRRDLSRGNPQRPACPPTSRARASRVGRVVARVASRKATTGGDTADPDGGEVSPGAASRSSAGGVA